MRRGSLAGGLVLVLIGLVFLLSNLGVLQISPWELVVSYWPLLLILAGVAVLAGASFRWLIVVLLVVVAGVALLGIPLGWSGPQERTTTTIASDGPVPGIVRLKADISLDAGLVRTGGPSAELYRVRVTHPVGTTPRGTIDLEGDLARLQVESRGQPVTWGRNTNELLLGFRQDVELDLELRLSAGEINVDLTPYDLRRLSIRNSAGKVTATLGIAEETVPVEVRVSAGDLVIHVPRATGLRVTGGTSVGATDFGNAGLRQVGSAWEDDAYSSAAGRFELDLVVSVGKITISRY